MARRERGPVGGEEEGDVEIDELVPTALEEIHDAGLDHERAASRHGSEVASYNFV